MYACTHVRCSVLTEWCWLFHLLHYTFWNAQNRSLDEIPARLEYFKAAVEMVAVHNADDEHQYKLRLNQFADWSEPELERLFEVVDMKQELQASVRVRSVQAFGTEKMREPVNHINWASDDNPLGRSVVTPVRNQGLCGMFQNHTTCAAPNLKLTMR